MTEYNREFVKWLVSLEYSGAGRQTIARLRRLSYCLDEIVPELMPWIVELDDPLPAKIVGGLYGLYRSAGRRTDPDTNPAHNFGWSARRLQSALSPDGDPNGVEKHFRSTLSADLAHMLINMRWFFSMFTQHDIPVNWLSLMNAMTEWKGDRFKPLAKSVRMEWSRMFWGGSA